MTHAGTVKLTDFGLAGGLAVAADKVAGTPGYMAPEVLRGATSRESVIHHAPRRWRRPATIGAAALVAATALIVLARAHRNSAS